MRKFDQVESFFRLSKEDRHAICGWLLESGLDPSRIYHVSLNEGCVTVDQHVVDRNYVPVVVDGELLTERVSAPCPLPPVEAWRRFMDECWEARRG